MANQKMCIIHAQRPCPAGCADGTCNQPDAEEADASFQASMQEMIDKTAQAMEGEASVVEPK